MPPSIRQGSPSEGKKLTAQSKPTPEELQEEQNATKTDSKVQATVVTSLASFPPSSLLLLTKTLYHHKKELKKNVAGEYSFLADLFFVS